MNTYNTQNHNSLLNEIRNTGVKKNNAWMVSFGDLLTLMLCFILSLISYGHIKPLEEVPKKQENPSNISELDKKDEVSINKHPFGAEIASYKEEDTDRFEGERLDLVSADFVDDVLGAEAKDKLLTFINDNQHEGVVIRSCAELGGWYEALRQAFTVRKALLVNKLPRSQLQIELLGDACENIRDKDKSEVVVRVELKA